MIKIHQSNIIVYVKKVLKIRGRNLADKLTKVSGGFSYYEKDVSEIVNKKRAGSPNYNVDVFYKEFIEKTIEKRIKDSKWELKSNGIKKDDEEIRKGVEEKLLEESINFVKNGNLYFENYEGKDDSCYSYVKRMLKIGLANYEVDETNNKPKEKCISNQTLSVNGVFTGREDVLEDMHSILTEKKAVALRGIGGIGKTLIAHKYACEYEKEYECKQIITCQKSFTSYKQLLLELQLDGPKEDEFSDDEKLNERISIIKNTNEKTLLIFDNVDKFLDDNNIINNLLPDLKNTHMIFTSRLPQGAIGAKNINVDILPYEQQIELFEIHVGEKITDKEDMEYANRILDKIGGHTFLIELAAKSVSAACYDYKKIYDYLNREDSTNIPQITAEKDGTSIQNQLKDMVKTLLFDINPLDDIQKETLKLMSFFPTEGIQKRIFGALFGAYIVPLNDLYGKGWIKETSIDGVPYVSVHPVICDVIKDKFEPTYKTSKFIVEKICNYVSENVRDSFKDDVCKLIVSAIDTIDFDDDKLKKDEMLKLEKLILFLSDNYKYNDALEVCKIALDVYENKDSMDDIEYEIYTGLGRLSRRLANYKDAIKYFNKASNCAEEGSINKAKSLRRLGEVYRKDSKYEDALCFDEEAIKIFSKFDAKNEVAEATNAMGVVYINLSGIQENVDAKIDYLNKAKKSYEDAKEIWEIDDPDNQLAFSYHNIGTVYYNYGQIYNNEEYYEKALEFHNNGLEFRKKHDLNKTDIASSYAWLCKDCVGLKNFEKAEEYIMDSLKIREEILGKEHPDYAWSLDSYSDILVAQERYDEAVEVMEEVISIRKKVLSLEHKYTQKAIKKLKKLKEEIKT